MADGTGGSDIDGWIQSSNCIRTTMQHRATRGAGTERATDVFSQFRHPTAGLIPWATLHILEIVIPGCHFLHFRSTSSTLLGMDTFSGRRDRPTSFARSRDGWLCVSSRSGQLFAALAKRLASRKPGCILVGQLMDQSSSNQARVPTSSSQGLKDGAPSIASSINNIQYIKLRRANRQNDISSTSAGGTCLRWQHLCRDLQPSPELPKYCRRHVTTDVRPFRSSVSCTRSQRRADEGQQK